MSQQKEPITKDGLAKIQQELDQLIKVERETLKTTIAEARELGDLKENAEYHAAKEKQAHVEGRISQLQAVIASANVIDTSKIESKTIVFGATVTLVASETGEEVTYKIVGKDESDKASGTISYTSPIGKALLGKEEGDTVVVRAPKGDVEYEVDSFMFE